MYHPPLERIEWLAVWGLIWGASLAHVAFWLYLFRDGLQTTFWWLL
jgi:hypothetical protein